MTKGRPNNLFSTSMQIRADGHENDGAQTIMPSHVPYRLFLFLRTASPWQKRHRYLPPVLFHTVFRTMSRIPYRLFHQPGRRRRGRRGVDVQRSRRSVGRPVPRRRADRSGRDAHVAAFVQRGSGQDPRQPSPHHAQIPVGVIERLLNFCGSFVFCGTRE